MTSLKREIAAILVLSGSLVVALPATAGAVEMRISRDALQRTLKQQLFAGADGRYYLKGTPQSACSTWVEDPQLSFAQDRIVVRVKTHAHMGKAVGGSCIGLPPLSLAAQVSMAPDAEGETIGFRDAHLDKVSDRSELNFLLSPFLSRQVPSSMKVNAADILRKALADSTATSGYKISLDRLKIHSILIDGDSLVVDLDGDLSVK